MKQENEGRVVRKKKDYLDSFAKRYMMFMK